MLASGETRGIVPQKTSSLRRGAVINASNFRIAASLDRKRLDHRTALRPESYFEAFSIRS